MRRLLYAIAFLFACGCDVVVTTKSPGPSGPTTTPDRQSGLIRVHFTRPEISPNDPQNIARALVGYIDKAQKTIEVCAHELDNRAITEALVNAVKRGVKVRLVTETNYIEESGVQALKAVGVPVVDDQRDGALMHNKFMIFDNRSVWTGSMNFTENCAYRNNNHGIFIEDARIAANYATKFRWMFEERKFGGLPNRSAKIPNPVVKLPDGTTIENYFSTHDHVADRVIEKIGQATSSIHFLAFSFTHDDMGQMMLSRARAGVPVQGVFERTQSMNSFSEYGRLAAAGPPVEVYLDANSRNMHHKVIIVDGSITIAGSFNFSEGADRQNDENVVVIHNRDIAKTFEAEFQTVFTAARKANTSGTVMSSKR